MPLQTLYALIHREEDLYVAFCPETGTASQGASPEAALTNLREATELYLQDFVASPRTGPVFLTTFEVNCPDEWRCAPSHWRESQRSKRCVQITNTY